MTKVPYFKSLAKLRIALRVRARASSIYRISKESAIPYSTVYRFIVHGRNISAEYAFRLQHLILEDGNASSRNSCGKRKRLR